MVERTFRRLLLGLLTSVALALAMTAAPVVPGALTAASAQVSVEFQEALEPYGHWQRHPRWGEVWVPDELPPDWRPYEYGHWVYTDEWGWYWISDPEEQDWGWVVFHYGRWAHDAALGWFWIPGDEWGPAWVDWRYGEDYVGWAPLPPDDIIVEYDDTPTYWVFVSPRYIAEPRWRSYRLPPSRRVEVFSRTYIINRTVGYGRGRAAVNAGISPVFVARASHRALPTYRVTPHVLAGTQGVAGAVSVSAQQLQSQRGSVQRGRRPSTSRVNTVVVQQSTTVIQPTAAAPAVQPRPPQQPSGAPAPQPQRPVAPPPTEQRRETPPQLNQQRPQQPQHEQRRETPQQPQRPVSPAPEQRRETPPPQQREREERPHAPPAAVQHPQPPQPAARPAPPQHPAPPPPEAHKPPPAKPAAKPEEKKKEEPPK